MHRTAWILCSLMLVADAAAAAAPPSADDVIALVKKTFLTPLAQHETGMSRYSRMPMPPPSRRVRVDGATPVEDTAGARFVRFTVDEQRFGGDWRLGVMTGCAYPDTGAVYVKRGEKLRPAAAYLAPFIGGLGTRAKVVETPASACVARGEHVAAR